MLTLFNSLSQSALTLLNSAGFNILQINTSKYVYSLIIFICSVSFFCVSKSILFTMNRYLNLLVLRAFSIILFIPLHIDYPSINSQILTACFWIRPNCSCKLLYRFARATIPARSPYSLLSGFNPTAATFCLICSDRLFICRCTSTLLNKLWIKYQLLDDLVDVELPLNQTAADSLKEKSVKLLTEEYTWYQNV